MKERLTTLSLYLIFWFVRLLVALRYRLVIKGLDKLSKGAFKRPGGILFLPNHPAEIDPIILEMVLWRRFRPRPLVVEYFFNNGFFKFFLGLVKAMPLPSMDIFANKWRAKKVDAQFNSVASELKMGRSFLIYPSGRLKLSGMELIGGASFVHKLMQACPEANVVLVRTTGLWGSQFSRAITGTSPDFAKVLFDCAKILLKNGIFFAPKRDIVVELDLPPADFPWKAESRLEFNKYLENWYNRYPEPGPEPLKLISYAFWKKALPNVYSASEQQAVEVRPVTAKVQKEVAENLGALCRRSPEGIDRKMHLSHDLGLDSLDVAQVYVFLDERYGRADLLPGDLQTVEDVMQAAAGYVREREEAAPAEAQKAFAWPKDKKRLPIEIPDGETLQEVFLRSVERNGNRTACMDALGGPLSYHRMKFIALLLSKKMRELPGDKIGIMLPASSGATLFVFAVLLAGKIPVMLNWTSGVKALDHAVGLTEMQAVVTSLRFLERMENGDLGKIEQMLHFTEDLRSKLTLCEKIGAYFLSLRGTKSLMKKLGITAKGSDPGVILFTSGTEALPKGVPLSHFNLLSNERACLKPVKMLPDDILFGVLPPFHSFGFSVTGMFPLLAGMKVCYSPDPTDSHGLARDIAQWKPTLFCCAPSFIRALFRVSKPESLQSLRIIVSGAEKTPQELFDYIHEHLPHGQLLEGYGITECSPVVTIDYEGEAHHGVGRALPGIELMVVDEDRKPVPQGEEGEVCIAGPNVFNGYLGSPRDPFINVGGKRWYLSGDRGVIDKGGHLVLSGRLKRFVKIGGEMVSLGGLEDELLKMAQDKNWATGQEQGPPLAVTAREKDSDKPLIILFTTFAISKEDINSALKDSGYGRIVKIAEVRKIEQIPLTGTGKTHYRLLDEMLS